MRYFVDGKRATLHDAQRALRGGHVVSAQHQRGATVSTYAGRRTKEGEEIEVVVTEWVCPACLVRDTTKALEEE